jgi:hypothetical protein
MQIGLSLASARRRSRISGAMSPTRIVTYVHRPKRQRKKREAPALAVPAIVTHSKRGARPRTETAADPDSDVRIRAWLAKQLRPPGS